MINFVKLNEEGRLLVLPPKCKPTGFDEDNGIYNFTKCMHCPIFNDSTFECNLWREEYCFDRKQVIDTLNQEVLEEYPE